MTDDDSSTCGFGEFSKMADAFFSSSWAQSVLGEQNPRAHRRRCTKHNTDQGRHRHSRSCLDVQQRDDCAVYRPRRSQNPRLAADESSRRSALTRGWLPPGDHSSTTSMSTPHPFSDDNLVTTPVLGVADSYVSALFAATLFAHRFRLAMSGGLTVDTLATSA